MSVIADKLSKSFGKVNAVKELSFEVNKGELFGIIGPDGAGKTTLFRILTSLLIPDGGQAIVENFDTVRHRRQIRKIIGYMPGKFSLYQDLTVHENLNFFATIFNTSIKENYHLIKDIYIQLEPFKKRRAGKLSGGMKQKLALCCALIHEPKVLFLDEPTTGVDAVSRIEFWDMLYRLKDRGITILVSTPYMDEASRCERIALIRKGEILKIDSPNAMIEQYEKQLFEVRSDHFLSLIKDLRNQPYTDRVEPFGEYLHLTTQPQIGLDQIEKSLATQNHKNLKIRKAKVSIEDIFLDMN